MLLVLGICIPLLILSNFVFVTSIGSIHSMGLEIKIIIEKFWIFAFYEKFMPALFAVKCHALSYRQVNNKGVSAVEPRNDYIHRFLAVLFAPFFWMLEAIANHVPVGR